MIKVLMKNGKAVMKNGAVLEIQEAPGPEPRCLTFTAEAANSSVQLSIYGYEGVTPWSLEYSVNNGNWSTYTIGTTANLPNIGDTVRFRALGSNIGIQQTTSSRHHFTMTGKIRASGEINALLDPISNEIGQLQFYDLFSYCSSLTAAPELPATTLASNCYQDMFFGCSSLATAPALPATTLASGCYRSMFEFCSSLTTAPALPATTLVYDCYGSMFEYCSWLKVYSVSGAGHEKPWRLPQSGEMSKYSNQERMFNDVKTDSVPADLDIPAGGSVTYYTEFDPVQ